MANFSHFTLSNRISIEASLNQGESLTSISKNVQKCCSSISREIRGHLQFVKSGGCGRAFNDCKHRYGCDQRNVCSLCTHKGPRVYCWSCGLCISHCPAYEQQTCTLLDSPPYVCNGCADRPRCTLEKRFYRASYADSEYRQVLSESREGLSLSEEEIQHLDALISPLIRQGQSLNHICASNQDQIMVSESTLYRLIEYGLFSVCNIDLPRKVRYSKRKSKKTFKVDKACRIGRTYDDFLAYHHTHPDSLLVEMDSVVGKKGGKVLLTIHFVKAELMLAFLRDANDSQSVLDIFDRLYIELRPDIFMQIFPAILTDNGSEFSNPKAIEFDRQGNQRTNVFYCDPSMPGQKGSAERNHELIRCCIKKGTSMDDLSQEMISHMMNHINSYCRESLGNKCPYDMFEFLYGKKILELLGCIRIPANEVTLTPDIFRPFCQEKEV